MSKFPVESQDSEGIRDAVNYLLSGPGGLGQNFAGFSAYAPAWLTGNFRVPYTKSSATNIYVAPIACSSALQLDDRTFEYVFSSAQPAPPFSLGNNIAGSGWTNGFYDGGQGVIGVIACSTTSVIFRTTGSYPGVGDDLGGGFVFYDQMSEKLSTDCNARVTVTGGTDRVFIAGQLCDVISYSSTTGGDLTYTVQINRYKGFINNDPINPDYLFEFDETVSQKIYTQTGLTGTGTLSEIETVFSTVVDQPSPGYYWYILEVQFDATGDLIVESAEFNLRSLSAQVVKQ